MTVSHRTILLVCFLGAILPACDLSVGGWEISVGRATPTPTTPGPQPSRTLAAASATRNPAPAVKIVSPAPGARLPAAQPLQVQFTADGGPFTEIVLLVGQDIVDRIRDAPQTQFAGTLKWNAPKPGKYRLIVAIVSFSGEKASAQVEVEFALETLSPRVTMTPLAWTGGTIPVETRNLIAQYPDFLDGNETRQHAALLQKAFDAYWELFAFGKEDPFDGRKTTFTFDLKVQPSTTTSAFDIKMGVSGLLLNRLTIPPLPIYHHEMAHAFQYAQWRAGRHYVDRFIDGMNESFADYFGYYYGRELSKDKDSARYFEGWREKADTALRQYEADRIDPYTLDWGEHPPPPSGEQYFFPMLFQISDRCGWSVWQKFYASRAGRMSAFPQEKKVDMRHPLIKKGFADFIAGLSQACGQDLAPLFRAWRFDL